MIGAEAVPAPGAVAPVESRRPILTALLLAVIAAIAFSVRAYPVTIGLDPSWVYGINYAHARGLIFGQDVFFTYGPLGWLAAPMDVGRNLVSAIAFQTGLWIAFVAVISWFAVARRIRPSRLLVFTLCLWAGRSTFHRFEYWGTEMFLAFLALLLLGGAASETSPVRGHLFHAAAWALGVLLLFVKFSVGISVVGAAALLSAGFLFTDRSRAIRSAVVAALGAPLLFVVAYLAYYPSPAALLRYVRSALEISSGYSTAMSLPGPPVLLVMALVILLSWLWFTSLLYRLGDPTFPLAFSFAAPWFVLFKHSFVRGSGHSGMIFAFTPLLWGIVLLFQRVGRQELHRLIPPMVLAAPVVGLTIVLGAIAETAPPAPLLALDTLPQEITAAIGSAPVAIYPYELAYAAANHLNFRPFPVLQAYGAYTPYLARADARFLEDPKTAPAFILFDWETINQRHPFLDVPTTALTIYRHYEPVTIVSGHMLLRRRTTPRFGLPSRVGTTELHLGSPFAVPPSSHPLIAAIHLRLTPAGALRKFFFRIPEVLLQATTDRGVFTVRVPPEVIEDGIPLNFLPWNLDEARMLLEGGKAPARLDSLTITGPGAAFYRDRAAVDLLEIP